MVMPVVMRGCLAMPVPMLVAFFDRRRLQRGVEAVPLPPMRVVVCMVMIAMIVPMQAIMIMAMAARQLPPSPPSDPEAKSDQRHAGGNVDELSIPSCRRCPDDPDDDTQHQRRRDVTGARDGSRTSRLEARPAPLPRQQSYWQPVVRNGGVENPDANDAEHEEQFGKTHSDT